MIKARNYIPCTICGSNNMQLICRARSDRIFWLKVPISICRNCGFVLINPRWTKQENKKIIESWYPNKYIQALRQQDISENDFTNTKIFNRWKKMHERIAEYYPKGIKNVLDIGSGPGFCIAYLKQKYPAIKAYAIEIWEQYQKNIIKKYQGKIIGTDVEGDWDAKYKNHFHLIVFRHTLEHIMEPKPVLEKLREYLHPQGYAYIVVPSIRAIDKNIKYSYFRPFHVSYFCKESLKALTSQVGLIPEVIKEKGEKELWGLFKIGTKKQSKPQVYKETIKWVKGIQRRQIISTIKIGLHLLLKNMIKKYKR